MKTPVIFKYDKGSKDVVAIFPQEPGSLDAGMCSCFTMNEEHSYGSDAYFANLKKAWIDRDPKVKELWVYLTNVRGYDLVLRSAFTPYDYDQRMKKIHDSRVM